MNNPFEKIINGTKDVEYGHKLHQGQIEKKISKGGFVDLCMTEGEQLPSLIFFKPCIYIFFEKF